MRLAQERTAMQRSRRPRPLEVSQAAWPPSRVSATLPVRLFAAALLFAISLTALGGRIGASPV